VRSDSKHRRRTDVGTPTLSSLPDNGFPRDNHRMLLDGYDEVDFPLLPRIAVAKCPSFGPVALILRNRNQNGVAFPIAHNSSFGAYLILWRAWKRDKEQPCRKVEGSLQHTISQHRPCCRWVGPGIAAQALSDRYGSRNQLASAGRCTEITCVAPTWHASNAGISTLIAPSTSRRPLWLTG